MGDRELTNGETSSRRKSRETTRFLSRQIQSRNRLTGPQRLAQNAQAPPGLSRNGLRQLQRFGDRIRSQRASLRRHLLDRPLSRPCQLVLPSGRRPSRSQAAPPWKRKCCSSRQAPKRDHSRRSRNRFPHERRARPRQSPTRSKTTPPPDHQVHLGQTALPPPLRKSRLALSLGNSHQPQRGLSPGSRALGRQFISVFHIHPEHPHRCGHNRRPGHQAQQSKRLQTAKHPDKQQKFVQTRAVPQEQRPHNIVCHRGHSATNQHHQDSFPPVSG